MMSPTEFSEISEVFNRVRTWVPEMRLMLTHKILETLEPSKISKPPKTISPDQVFGVLKTNSPPPGDEQCEKMVEEERVRKHE